MQKIVIGLLLLIISTFAIAQDTTQNTPVSVAFKYKAGETLKYQLGLKGEGKLKLSSKDTSLNVYGFNTTLPANLDFNAYISASTLSVSTEGNGTFDISLDNAHLSFDIFNQKIKIDVADKKFQMYTNEQLYMEESLDSVGQKGFLTKPVPITFDKYGKVINIDTTTMEDLKSSPQAKAYNMEDWKDKAIPLIPD